MPEFDPLPNLDDLASAVGAASSVAYGPAFIYPISAPAFVARPRAQREHPRFSHLYLYVHIPFCNYACNFCYYAKRIGANRDQKERYVAALLRELTLVEPGTTLSQLFVGGGTPTALPPDLLAVVLAGIKGRMGRVDDGDHTVEVSPESLLEEHLAVLKQNGVRRVSMGIQTLREDVLAKVRRKHTSREALDACDKVVRSGLILNVDMMYGLPGYSEQMLQSDIEALADRGVHSVTFFNLRVNKNTPVSTLIGADEQLDLARLVRWRAFIRKIAAKLGYVQTRWTTFQRPDGVGASYRRAPAATDSGEGRLFGIGMSSRSHLGYTIYRNHENLEAYIERIDSGESPVEQVLELDEGDRKAHYVAHTLGDGRSLDVVDYERSFGRRFDEEFQEPLQRLRDGGLVAVANGEIKLTETGKLVYDRITEAFYPTHAREWLARQQDSLRRPAGLPVPGRV